MLRNTLSLRRVGASSWFTSLTFVSLVAMFVLLGAAIKPTHASQSSDVICSGGQFHVVGSLSFKQVFILVVYDLKVKAHIMYIFPPDIIVQYVFTGTIPLHGAPHDYMKNIINFDPARDSKNPREIFTIMGHDPIDRLDLVGNSVPAESKDTPERLLLFYYDPMENEQIDSIIVRSNLDECKHEVQKAPINLKSVNVLSHSHKGFLLQQCPFDLDTWCSVDIQWNSGTSWVSKLVFQVAEQTTGNGITTSLLFVVAGHQVPSGASLVKWQRVNGFISPEVQTVVLFADDFVYTYQDPMAEGKYNMFDPNKPYFNFTAIKVPVTSYFSCDGKIFSERISIPKAAKSNSYRIKIIYGLFAAHFFVAIVMIVIIIFLNAKGGSAASSSLAKGSDKSPKRVRKARRSKSSRERSQSSATKSRIGSQSSAK